MSDDDSEDGMRVRPTAVGREHELGLHLRVGLTGEEIAEVLLHTAVYAGVPAANTALGIADRVLNE